MSNSRKLSQDEGCKEIACASEGNQHAENDLIEIRNTVEENEKIHALFES
jgi:hypothetical protein